MSMERLSITPDVLRDALKKDQDLMTGIHSTYRNSLKNEQNLMNLRIKMNQEFQTLAKFEKNSRMVGVYNELNKGLSAIAQSHSIFIRDMEQKVIPVIATYPTRINEVKTILKNYESKSKVFTKKQEVIGRATDASKRDAAQKDAESSRVEFTREATKLCNFLREYEHNRLSDFKQVLLHNINAEMHYHARALEKLSQMAFEVNKIDDKKEAEFILSQMITGQQAPGLQNQPTNISQAQRGSQPAGLQTLSTLPQGQGLQNPQTQTQISQIIKPPSVSIQGVPMQGSQLPMQGSQLPMQGSQLLMPGSQLPNPAGMNLQSQGILPPNPAGMNLQSQGTLLQASMVQGVQNQVPQVLNPVLQSQQVQGTLAQSQQPGAPR